MMGDGNMILGDCRIGFVGGGAMAGALMAGFINAGLVQPDRIYVSDVNPECLTCLQTQYGIQVVTDNKGLVDQVDVVILAVKPMVLDQVLMEVGAGLTEDQTVISIIAGRTTGYVEQHLAARVPVVRAMPNTPALVGSGATAVCCGRWAGKRHLDLGLALFNAVGRAVPVTENLMDAVTGLSGSGPAYMYIMIEALADAGVRAGLPRDVAQTLAAQTMLGAARMVLETSRHPGVLKDMVTTPGGTTIEGLLALEEGGLRATLGRAVQRASERSRQLAGAGSVSGPDGAGDKKCGVTK